MSPRVNPGLYPYFLPRPNYHFAAVQGTPDQLQPSGSVSWQNFSSIYHCVASCTFRARNSKCYLGVSMA
jgi:hypothetical protein